MTASEQTTFGRGAPAGWRSTATWMRLSAIGTSTPTGTSNSRAQAPVASTTRSQRDIALLGANPADAAALDDQRAHPAAELRLETVGVARGEPAEDHLVRVGEAAVGLVGRAGDAVECEQRLDLRDLGGPDERRLEPERREPRDIVARGLHERLRHGQEIAGLDVAGIADPHLLGPVHDRARAAIASNAVTAFE